MRKRQPEESTDLHSQGLTNLKRAGELFMYCVWTQGIMASLVVLFRNERLRSSFLEYHEQLPSEFVRERTKLLRKPFSKILEKFRKEFSALISSPDNELLDFLTGFRDLLAHCHVSLGRRYLLWGPMGSFENRISAFGLKSDPSAEYRLVKFDGADDELYLKCIGVVQQIDEGLFSRVSKYLGIDYRYIR